MIKFSLPGYYQHQPVVFYFAILQNEHPEYFIENRCLDSTYDLPAHLIWNGGRINHQLHADPSDVWSMADAYHNIGIHLRHTCTNCMLEPFHFSDVLCNNWIRYNEKEGESVIVHNSQLAEYIRTYYPKYNIIWSTTRQSDTIEKINNLSEKDMVVIDYKYNHDISYLSQLTHPENIEILCAEYCVPNCPNRQAHYKSISKHQLWMPMRQEDIMVCPYENDKKNLTFYDSLQMAHGVTNEYINELYQNYKIQNFKISGRAGSPMLVIEAACYYLIKPEYRDLVRHQCLLTL